MLSDLYAEITVKTIAPNIGMYCSLTCLALGFQK